MRVRDVMTSDVVSVAPDTPFKEVVSALLRRGISATPVLDAERRVVGIITEADLMAREVYDGRRRRPLRLIAEYFSGRDPGWLRRSEALVARELMTRAVHTVEPEADVRQAARRMLEENIKRLVVVDHSGRLIGIVTRADVLRLFYAPDSAVVEAVAELLADEWRVPDGIDVDYSVLDGIVRLEGSVHFPSDRTVVEHMVQGLPGVVGIDSRLVAREPEPKPSTVARV
ncbi:MAG: CBS domain-containing protein [Actinobacteria bacterium]|nr:CBS domain-containing protein [Actinomycetota bacterium]